MLGGLAAAPLARRYGSGRITWLPMAVWSTPALLIPLAAPGARLALVTLGWGCWTFSAVVCSVGLVTYRQATCPAMLLPRVTAAARWICWGPLPVGAAAGGVLGTALGLRTALWGAVVSNCAAGTWFFFSPLRTVRDLPSPAPALSTTT